MQKKECALKSRVNLHFDAVEHAHFRLFDYGLIIEEIQLISIQLI